MKVFPRRGARALASPAFLAARFAFVGAGVASACDCQFGGAARCQAFWRADAIFAGTVVGVARTSAGASC